MSLEERLRKHWEGDLFEAREVPGRGLCVLRRFICTMGLLVNAEVDEWNCDYEARYCYPSHREAARALSAWDGTGDPPGPWIKEKVSGRPGPGAQTVD